MKKEYAKLPVTFKRQWLKALRSGKYDKGVGYLKQETPGKCKWCCLGVAADICNVKGIKDDLQYIQRKKGLRGITKVPNILIGDANENNIVNRLVNLNDKNKTFEKVITWIEKNL